MKHLALPVVRDIFEKLQKSPYVTIMIDETTDITNQGLVTVVMLCIL